MRWLQRTALVHSHCSCGVCVFVGCSFHLRKYGIATMIQGTAAAKVCNLRQEHQHIRNSDTLDNHLVKQKTHKTRSDSRIANPDIPSRPLLFEPVERREIGTLIVLFS